MSIDYSHLGNLRKAFEEINIKEVMITSPVKLYQDDEFSVAEEIFINKRIFYLPVLNRRDEVVGLLSRRYIYKTRSPRKIMDEDMRFSPGMIVDGDTYYDRDTLNSYILRRVMSKKPLTLRPDQSFAKALLIMRDKKISCIPIVLADNTLCGVLTEREVIKFIAELLSI